MLNATNDNTKLQFVQKLYNFELITNFKKYNL